MSRPTESLTQTLLFPSYQSLERRSPFLVLRDRERLQMHPPPPPRLLASGLGLASPSRAALHRDVTFNSPLHLPRLSFSLGKANELKWGGWFLGLLQFYRAVILHLDHLKRQMVGWGLVRKGEQR